MRREPPPEEGEEGGPRRVSGRAGRGGAEDGGRERHDLWKEGGGDPGGYLAWQIPWGGRAGSAGVDLAPDWEL